MPHSPAPRPQKASIQRFVSVRGQAPHLTDEETETQGGSSSGKGGHLPDKAGEEENPDQLLTVHGGGSHLDSLYFWGLCRG